MTRPRAIEVHIDELVLHGFSAAEADRIAEAVGAELAHLYTERGLQRPPRNWSAYRAEAVSIVKASPTRIGTDIARALHTSMAR